MHTGPANHPWGLINKPAHNIAMLGLRHMQGWIMLGDLDHHAIWRGYRLLTIGDCCRVICLQTQAWARRVGRTARIQSQPHTMARQHRHRRIIGRINLLQAEAERLCEKGKIITNIG